jgi:hypothetical protein
LKGVIASIDYTMCNLYGITTDQAAIIALFRVVNRYVGNLPPMPGVFSDYPAPVKCPASRPTSATRHHRTGAGGERVAGLRNDRLSWVLLGETSSRSHARSVRALARRR